MSPVVELHSSRCRGSTQGRTDILRSHAFSSVVGRSFCERLRGRQGANGMRTRSCGRWQYAKPLAVFAVGSRATIAGISCSCARAFAPGGWWNCVGTSGGSKNSLDEVGSQLGQRAKSFHGKEGLLDLRVTFRSSCRMAIACARSKISTTSSPSRVPMVGFFRVRIQ